MGYEQYWHGDPLLVRDYREAERLRLRRTDAEAHLQGLYFYEALLDASPILHAFAKKGAKPLPYPKQPYSFRDSAGSAPTEQQKENERLKAVLFFKNWAREAGRKFDGK